MVLGRSVRLDSSGNVFTVGEFLQTADFDPGPGSANLTSGGSRDAFVSKLDSAGNFVWVSQLGGSGNVRAYAMAVDPAGSVYTVGNFENTADFDPGSGVANLTSAGSNDVFVSKLDGAGSLVWARQLGGTSSEGASGVALDGARSVYTVGQFRGTADFDPGPGAVNLTSAGVDDVFISKLSQPPMLPSLNRAGLTLLGLLLVCALTAVLLWRKRAVARTL